MTSSHHDKLSQLRRIRQNEKKRKNFSSGGGGKKNVNLSPISERKKNGRKKKNGRVQKKMRKEAF